MGTDMGMAHIRDIMAFVINLKKNRPQLTSRFGGGGQKKAVTNHILDLASEFVPCYFPVG